MFYNCGESGHRSFECRANSTRAQGNGQNRGSLQNQDNMQNQGSMQNQGNTQGTNPKLSRPQTAMPQPATCVEIQDDNLDLPSIDTDPMGTVMMSTNLVEIMNVERKRMVIERIKKGVYTM